MRKMIQKYSGYTLIELLVVISISALLFTLAIASYQNFNKTQALKTAAEEVKSVLRDAQNRAISGQKDTSACGLHTDPILLLEWRFSWTRDTRNYSIEGICKKGSELPQTFGLQTFTLPATDNIIFTTPKRPAPEDMITTGTISFKPLHQGVTVSDSICIEGDSGSYYNISVGQSGDINVTKTGCP